MFLLFNVLEYFVYQCENMFKKTITIFLVVILRISAQNEDGKVDLTHYYAAVVEFYQETNYSITAHESLRKTTADYIEIIRNLTRNYTQPLDLIVFPESTLADKNYPLPEIATKIPQNTNIILCNSTSENYSVSLKNLSCAAMNFGTVIVVNLVEKEECSSNSCSEETLYFNTNVVLGSNGTVWARYRKYNLFGESGITKPSTVDMPVFDIKNTSFGMIICFDIQFGTPGLDLVKKMGVKNVIYPLRWISELPYLTALQTQQMWAEENEVVLLASGANMPSNGAGGTGIFYGNEGPLQSDIFATTRTKVIYQKVPVKSADNNVTEYVTNFTEMSTKEVDSLAKDMDDFFILVDPSIKDHNSITLDVNTTPNCKLTTVNHQVCHGEYPNVICCNFNVTFSLETQSVTSEKDKAYTYHLVAFNGIRTYSGLYYGGIEACGLVACLNKSVTSCGQRFPHYSEILWPIAFHHVNITANFSQSPARIQFPTALLSSIRPIAPQLTSWTRKISDAEGTVFRSHVLKEKQNRLITFGIFGRDFSRDWDPVRNTTNGGSLENYFEMPFLTCIVWILAVFLL